MDAIRTAALAAVAEVGTSWTGGAKVIQAMKLVRDRTECDLQAAKLAVEWAIERPPAADLPLGSIAAGTDSVFLKRDNRAEPTMPWSGTADGIYVNDYSDEEIDDMVQRGEVTILRVGNGAS